MSIWSSINCPTVICSPTVCYFSREKPLVKYTAPGLFFNIFAFAIYFPLLLFLDLLNQKYKNTLPRFIIIYFIWCSIYESTTIYSRPFANFWHRYPKGIDNPLTRRLARCCYLCAGAIYIVLLGSPTGLITLVSSLREIPTVAMLHHPFLFGEMPT